jgi:S-formylglutathione hydrolase FrmB
VTDLALSSRAMGGIVHVDVMVPVGYQSSGVRRYPVLYLLHGFSGTYHDWVDNGVESIVGDLPLIVVMPDDGYDGSYTDWYGQTVGVGPKTQPPAWQTFDIDELIPFIDGHYRTIASRAGRAIAGVSSGGFGAMKYAATFPQLFDAAGSFSGADDIDLDYPAYPLETIALDSTTLGTGDGPPAYCTWGDPLTNDVFWQANDPTQLAGNLHGVALYLTSGNGLPGPFDHPIEPGLSNLATSLSNMGSYLTDTITEATIWQMNEAFVSSLNADGVSHTDDFYGPGTHSWPYWTADLKRFLPWLMDNLVNAASPATFSYESAEPSFSAWGWSFDVQRTVSEFVYLSGVGRGGFTVSGSGTLEVTTPGVYGPGSVHEGTTGASATTVRADSDGALHFAVRMGPSHLIQQVTFGVGPPIGWTRTTVTIR